MLISFFSSKELFHSDFKIVFPVCILELLNASFCQSVSKRNAFFLCKLPSLSSRIFHSLLCSRVFQDLGEHLLLLFSRDRVNHLSSHICLQIGSKEVMSKFLLLVRTHVLESCPKVFISVSHFLLNNNNYEIIH